MHELAIAESIVDIVSERAGEARVRKVTLEIGRLSGVMPEAIRFCFDVCAQGTVLAGAALEIVEPPGRGRCRDCGRVAEMRALFDGCECGAGPLEPVAGGELKVREMELA